MNSKLTAVRAVDVQILCVFDVDKESAIRDVITSCERGLHPSRPFRCTKEQGHLSALLVACERSGLTEAQTIEEMFKALRDLEGRLMKALMLAPPPAIIVPRLTEEG